MSVLAISVLASFFTLCLLVRRLRSVKCPFCQKPPKLRKLSKDIFQCPSCETRFSPDPDEPSSLISLTPPTVDKENILDTPLNNKLFLRSAANGLCRTCHHHQLIIAQLMKDAENEDPVSYRHFLEKKYPLCYSCELKVQRKLKDEALRLKLNYVYEKQSLPKRRKRKIVVVALYYTFLFSLYYYKLIFDIYLWPLYILPFMLLPFFRAAPRTAFLEAPLSRPSLQSPNPFSLSFREKVALRPSILGSPDVLGLEDTLSGLSLREDRRQSRSQFHISPAVVIPLLVIVPAVIRHFLPFCT